MSQAARAYSVDGQDFVSDVLDLYQHQGLAQSVDRFQGVDDRAVAFYREHGYLVVRQAFSTDEVRAAIESIGDLIDGKHPSFTGIQYASSVKDRIDQLTPEERRDSIRKLHQFLEFEEPLYAMCFKPELIDSVSRLLGKQATLYENDGQAHLKPPKVGREKPWHQDHAYFDLPQGTPIAGVWIALDRATSENGCMFVIPGSHREGPVVHFNRRDWQICDTDVQVNRSVAAVMEPGDCLFFDGLIHHGTPPNLSDQRRWALQFHYYPEGTQHSSTKERLEIFGSEGKDVTC